MKCIIGAKNKYTLILIIFLAGSLPAVATDWKGTWSSTFGELSISSTQTRNIVADMGDYIRVADLKGGKGVSPGFNHKYFFGGPYKDSDGKEGRFYFFIDVNNDPTLNSLTGYIYIKDKRYKHGQLDPYSPYNIKGITGTRTSSAEPNMNKYD